MNLFSRIFARPKVVAASEHLPEPVEEYTETDPWYRQAHLCDKGHLIETGRPMHAICEVCGTQKIVILAFRCITHYVGEEIQTTDIEIQNAAGHTKTLESIRETWRYGSLKMDLPPNTCAELKNSEEIDNHLKQSIERPNSQISSN